MVRARPLLLGLAAIVLHALARELDRALGLVLQAELEPRSLAVELWRALQADGAAAGMRSSLWLGGGILAWLVLAVWRRRASGGGLAGALVAESGALAVLWLRPALSLLALGSVVLAPSWPYAFTLPVALTQDWAIGQDLAALAAFVAFRSPAPRWPAPRAASVFLISFLGYALLAPDWAWRWEGHPGNEPKYLRQAVALSLFGGFDAEGVSTAMEALEPRGVAAMASTAGATVVRESSRLLGALARGEAGRAAIRATRVTRQTVRGKEGGIYYVLAPGPSLLLAPTLRLDRALNLVRGEPGRVPISVLLWCALAALLVSALFLLARDLAGREGLAAAVAFGFALLPPFLFYPYQFYPEMPGALVLAVAFRLIALRPAALLRHPFWFGLMLAGLPWLHQKFLPVWLAVALTAAWAMLREAGARDAGRPGWRAALGRARGPLVVLLALQAASLYLTALYNFAITGSVRPDALFLAWGPGGVSGARVGQGIFGILFDARFGILPWVPLLLLALAGALAGGARRLAPIWPAALVYYLTVASADNWSGAVCNLGRYVMPVAPLAVALVALALASAARGTAPAARRGAMAVALILGAWSALFAALLWRDPQAANDSALLLARSTFADGRQYLPDLFIRHWSEAAPGLWARIAAWVCGAALLALAMRRVRSASQALAAVFAVVLALGFGLERWPSARGLAAPAALSAGAEIRVSFSGAVRVREDEAILGPGQVDLLVRRRRTGGAAASERLRAVVGGQGLLRIEGLPAIRLRPTGSVVDLPLLPYHEVGGADGRVATFSRLGVRVEGQTVMRFDGEVASPPRPGDPAGAAPRQTVEPETAGSR